jgi:hypothetical protein
MMIAIALIERRTGAAGRLLHVAHASVPSSLKSREHGSNGSTTLGDIVQAAPGLDTSKRITRRESSTAQATSQATTVRNSRTFAGRTQLEAVPSADQYLTLELVADHVHACLPSMHTESFSPTGRNRPDVTIGFLAFFSPALTGAARIETTAKAERQMLNQRFNRSLRSFMEIAAVDEAHGIGGNIVSAQLVGSKQQQMEAHLRGNGMLFSGFSGACTGTSCALTLAADANVPEGDGPRSSVGPSSRTGG